MLSRKIASEKILARETRCTIIEKHLFQWTESKSLSVLELSELIFLHLLYHVNLGLCPLFSRLELDYVRSHSLLCDKYWPVFFIVYYLASAFKTKLLVKNRCLEATFITVNNTFLIKSRIFSLGLLDNYLSKKTSRLEYQHTQYWSYISIPISLWYNIFFLRYIPVYSPTYQLSKHNIRSVKTIQEILPLKH